MLQSVDHHGEDGDADAQEEQQEADFLVALSDGDAQRLQTWTQSRTEKVEDVEVTVRCM